MFAASEDFLALEGGPYDQFRYTDQIAYLEQGEIDLCIPVIFIDLPFQVAQA